MGNQFKLWNDMVQVTDLSIGRGDFEVGLT